jgi:leucyl aminopeptidase
VQKLAAKQGAPMKLMIADPSVAVVEVEDNELEQLSHLMHEQFGRCGGFIVHDSEDEAREIFALVPARPALDYTLDRGALVRDVLPALDRERIRTTIAELSAMPNRYYRSETGAAASTWLRDRWRSLTSRRDVSVELFDQGYPQKSVIMTIPGSTLPDEVVVLGGHLDSITMMGGKNGRAPGADDDASGIATLTEIARVLLANDYRPARTIKLIAYAAEEVGLRGSQAVVKDFKKRGVNVVGALQLDMTNYKGSDKDIWLMKDFTSAAQNTFVIALIEAYVGATWGMDACGYACSDHASWYRAGVPASMPFESRMRDRNMKIHTANDTLETSNNNADHAVKFARLGVAYAIELGKGQLGGAITAALNLSTVRAP